MDLRDKRIDLILQQLDGLPTLPAVAIRVLEATGSDQSSADDVVHLISSDPALTARILQLVHRADMGVRGDVNSIDRAVMLLGFDAVRSAVLAISVFQAFQSDNPKKKTGGFSREGFWKHCVAVACCCELLAREAPAGKANEPPLDPAEAFVCGLLHDLGKVALDAMLPKSFSRVIEAADLLRGDLADLERQIIGLDHMVVGKRLAEKWQLPAAIRESIWLHGQMPDALASSVRNKRMVNLVTLADQLVRAQHIGYSGNFSFAVPRQALLDAIGLDQTKIDSVLARLIEHIQPRAAALGLGDTNADTLYQQALAQANRELGRVSDQLITRSRKLAIRGKFFEALSAFQAEIRPDAPPQLVLHAIGQTAVAVLDVTSAAVFSLPPGRDYAEAVLVDGAGEVFETTLVDHKITEPTTADASLATAEPPVHPRLPGDGPVRPVGSDLDWFLTAVTPRLGHQNRYWISLEADGQCIGGVLWGGQTGESQRLSPQVQELTALAAGWSMSLRTAQIREEARGLGEQLAESNRQLQSAQSEILRKKTAITVGEMAAGAAHEMNNPLAVISGRSQLLSSQLSDPKHKAMARLIFDQSQRLSDIITDLMDFAKPVPPTPVESDVVELVNRSLHETKALPEHADRTVEMTIADVPFVTVDAKQVGAALAEIIDNALQATAGKPDKRVEIHAAYDVFSSNVVLSVSDNGVGMSEPTLKRAFDPFFSSKPAGRRRGMGLAKALRWVESSGGSIRLESHVNQGTRAVILLPAVPTGASEQIAPDPRTRKQA